MKETEQRKTSFIMPTVHQTLLVWFIRTRFAGHIELWVRRKMIRQS